MKKITRRLSTFVFLFSLAGIVCAQQNVIDKYFGDYEKDATMTKVNVGAKTFTSFSDINAKSTKEQDLIDALAQLDGIKAMYKEDFDGAKELYRKGFDKIITDTDYEELMSLRDNNEVGIMMIREHNGGGESEIQELMVMFSSDKEFGVFTIFGKIDLHQITNLAEVMRSNGQEWFELFEEVDMESIVFIPSQSLEGDQSTAPVFTGKGMQVTVFPNPATDHVILKSLNEKDGVYNLSFYSAIGKQLSTQKNVSLPHRLELANFPEGSYFVKITNEQGENKNFKIIKP